MAAIALLRTIIESAFTSAENTNRTPPRPATRKQLMTAREQQMFHRLRESLPTCHVFPQVAFSALLDSDDEATRAAFNRKVADFVICDENCRVIAEIELDDPTHNGREHIDRNRDRLLTPHYRVHRWRQIPSTDEIRAAVLQQRTPHFQHTQPTAIRGTKQRH